MNTNALKKFATAARTQLLREVDDQLTSVLGQDSLARKERPANVRRLEAESRADRKQLVERVAYTWFNRLAAFTYMDCRGYSADLFEDLQTARVVTPADGQKVPELLQLARAGQLDPALKLDRERLTRLLTKQLASEDSDAEVYRALLIATCQLWHEKMPTLFGGIDDYTELLVPRDLLSERSVLMAMRQAIEAAVPAEGTTADTERGDNVEVIGWLYQFYIADKKDEVFARKSGTKIEAKDIPAATQLFTPHWIVRYLVENSLGRLWLLNNPDSELAAAMPYYIQPEDEEAEQKTVLRVAKPEDIKICDPACGSGHMLTYAFELLMQIYESKAYRPSEAVAAILGHNLYGIEIDERAGALAAFALAMKARAYDKRYFRRGEIVQPQVCVLENVHLSEEELEPYMARVGHDLFTADLRETLCQFEQAKNLGSLIQPAVRDVASVQERIGKLKFEEDLFLIGTHEKVQLALKQAAMLSSRYQVVVANPPYMGGKGMNAKLKAFAKTEYADSKRDLFAMFMESTLAMTVLKGVVGMINMQSWMFLSSYEKLRKKLIDGHTILSMAHIGENGFDTIGGAVVSTTAFTLKNGRWKGYKGAYLRLVDGENEGYKSGKALKAITDPDCGWFFRASAQEFGKLPGSPISYQLPPQISKAYEQSGRLSQISKVRQGAATGDNLRFVRSWFEIDIGEIGKAAISIKSFHEMRFKYVFFNKSGGSFRWINNDTEVLRFDYDTYLVLNDAGNQLPSKSLYFKPGITFSKVTSGNAAFRSHPRGRVFSDAGQVVISDKCDWLMAYLNSSACVEILSIISPTMNYSTSAVANLPLPDVNVDLLRDLQEVAIKKTMEALQFEETWIEFECISLDKALSLSGNMDVHFAGVIETLEIIISTESSIDSYFNELFELSVPISHTMQLSKITGFEHLIEISEESDELFFKKKEWCDRLISYFLGTLFGRYALDVPGLILADAGATLADYAARVPDPTFVPDPDGIVPFVERGWFADDVVREWERFLVAAFGAEHLAENQAFVEKTLGKDVRQYFLKDFYADHVKRYKKRPIYWMFSSHSENKRGVPAFQCLIYLHRYTPDTCGKILEDYLKPLIRQLEDKLREAEEIAGSTSAQISDRDKSNAAKEAETLGKKLKECRSYATVLQPYVDNPISLDLDDGVLVNYNRFGRAVKEVAGLNDRKAREKVRGFDWCDVGGVPEYEL